MVQIVLFILILLLPAYVDAAYKIYLKNGSVISEVSSYEKKAGEVTIYFGGGSLVIPEKDILKIEETRVTEEDLRPKEEVPETREKPSEVVVPPPAPDADKSARVNALRSQLESITAEIKTVEEEEAGIVASINEKRGRRFKYNIFQLRQLEKEIEPLQQELFTVQQKKTELLQRKSSIEGELRALE